MDFWPLVNILLAGSRQISCKMSCLTTQERLVMLELCVQLDVEMAYYDLQIARLLQRHRRQVTPRRGRRPRRMWVRPWLQERDVHGQFNMLMDKLRLTDVPAFRNFTRMEPDFFFELLERLTPRIQKKNTWYRKAICAGSRLALTLRFFATGDSYMSLRYNWLVADNTISKIVREVSEAIIAEYAGEVLCPPTTQEGWLQVAETFSTRWNFHHTLGALDGKHVAIRRPPNSGSLYHNYKGFFSIVLMALVDGDYKFLWVDVGSNGASSDAQIYNDCELKEMLDAGDLGVPPAAQLPGADDNDIDVPYFFIGDDAFALRTTMMKPYSRRHLDRDELTFNYRLSRARRIVENAFGILVNRFGCLLTTLRVQPHTATSVTIACCCLHNLLRDAKAPLPRGLLDEEDAEHNLVAGTYRNEQLVPGQTIAARHSGTHDAKALRDYLKDYYSSPAGAVAWQDTMLERWHQD